MDEFLQGPVTGPNCRFYEKKYPEPEELVRVKIIEKEEHGFRCILLEYDNIEGLVLINELKRGRVRSYHKILKKQREYTVLVLRVHKQEGENEDEVMAFIDLSLKAVPRESLPTARDKWEKSKTVHGIMRAVAFRTKNQTINLYKKFGWSLSKKFKHIYFGFKYIMAQDDPKSTMKELSIPEECVKFLHRELAKRMEVIPENVRAKIEMTCFSDQGVSGILDSLQVGLNQRTKEFPLILRIIASPLFEICLHTMDPEMGKEKITDTMQKMKEALDKKGGKFKVVEEPIVERIVELLELELAEIDDASD